MSDGPSGADHRKPLLDRLAALLLRVPEDREQLLDLLRQAHERALLDAEAMSMIEGVLQISELTARDIMVPRAEMNVLDISQPPAAFLPKVVHTGHSRFPVVEGDPDNVVGILPAKSLLRLCGANPVDVHELLHPVLFVPESQRLGVLLRDLRAQRARLAIVVDEYGGTAGLVTLEDVIEQILGEVDDELDGDADGDVIVRVEPAPNGASRHRVRASVKVEAFNEAMGTGLPETPHETLGALVGDRLGRPPQRGERIEIGGVRFEVLRADATQALLLRTERLPGSGAVATPMKTVSTVAAGATGDDPTPLRIGAMSIDTAAPADRGERFSGGGAIESAALEANARDAKMRRPTSRPGSSVAHGG